MGFMTRVRSELGLPAKAAKPADAVKPAKAPGRTKAVRAPKAAAKSPRRTKANADRPAKPSRRQQRKDQKKLEGTFEAYPHLLALKPREKYVFRSDYFTVDQSVACVLAFFHDDAAHDGFAAFWGIDRIPDGLDGRVTAVVLEQVVRRDDQWVDRFVKQSEQLDRLEANEQEVSGTTSTRRKAQKVSGDLEQVIAELQNGASYLSVHNRLLLKAPDLETLEDSIERVARLYIDRFGTVKVAAYAGEQRQELSSLLIANDRKRGKGFGFTSTEFAGSYSLVTNGLNDRGGEYVGYMVGDVNNSAVLMDVDDFEHHVVIADQAVSEHMDRQHVADMWCSKISQSALLANRRVVHLVLDGADLDRLGPSMHRITSRVDLNSGDVNMFEMFGEEKDELAVFATHIEKLKLMFEQLYESSDGAISSIIRSNLEEIATAFYVDQRMWMHNAKENRRRLRVVNLPHDQVPRLQMFVSYLETAHKTLVNSSRHDPDQLRALNVLKGIGQTMLSTNGDLFNNFTATTIDSARDARRVVYDFSRLMRRGKGVAMAQLVNIIGFAVGRLEKGDVVIIHGAEHVDRRVKAYVEQQFAHLYQLGGRVVFSYTDVDRMLEDSSFNRFDAADYTIFGAMRSKTAIEYQEQLAQRIPPDLTQLITARGENLSYLRRGVSNVVFHLDLALGVNAQREAQRRKVWLEARQAEEDARMAQLMEAELVPGAQAMSTRRGSPGLYDDSRTLAAQRRELQSDGAASPRSAGDAEARAGKKTTEMRKLARR